MKKPAPRLGCVFGGLLILVLLVAAAGFFFLRSRPTASNKPPPSSVLVFLTSPSEGIDIEAGDFLPVSAQAEAPEGVQAIELFVDGASIGTAAEVDIAEWTWQAFPVGVHSLFARATSASGETGQSPTVIINVLKGDGVMEITATGGQTPDQVGAGFGVPPDQMAGANPKLDPAGPLQDGQPVNVPLPDEPPGGGGPGGGAAGPGGFPVSVITWEFTPTGPVDKSYCYTSTQEGFWGKMPKGPFEFFGGGKVKYLQAGIPTIGEEVVLQVECWGWLGGALKFLGSGGTKFTTEGPPEAVKIVAEGFQLSGLPEFPPIPTTGGGGLTVPPPFAVRQPTDAKDCTSHSHPLLAPFICDKIMSGKVSQYILIEWEWAPKTCWGSCPWVEEIDGYQVSELDPFTMAVKNTKTITNPSQKITAFLLPWGPGCYGVRAFTNSPTYMVSEMVTYCAGDVPKPQMTTLTPTQWLTAGGQWVSEGDCDTYGGADTYLLTNDQIGFGDGTGEILVGSYIVDDEDDDCYREGNYSGAVKFTQPGLPPGAVIQKATLRFGEIFTHFQATGVALTQKSFCVAGVGKALQDWSGQVGEHHFSSNEAPISGQYNSPITSLSEYDHTPQVDVTSAVKTWIKYPAKNFGLIFSPAPALKPAMDGYGECLTGAVNFAVDVYYFAP